MSFDAFYRQMRGRDPFPWMSRLAARMAAGDLPKSIDVPTGCGKSEFVLIWAWARQSHPELPRRLWMISDRRMIVDQTYEVALPLAHQHGILVSRLRGGMVLDTSDMLDPVRPQIITATVDQFGSRLLFRGYGASPRSWPIWAGLAGNDSLIVLDEAHLSPIAEDTFRASQDRLGADIRVISMTATPRLADAAPFTLDEADHANPVLGPRLAARRVVELRDGTSPADAAMELLARGCQRVAVICNTVRAARATFEHVNHPDKHLLIGRQRPLDRDAILEQLLPRVSSDAAPSDPLVVVATQCIEAGADFDFDGMVTEACPIDALRQRLGRLNRLGKTEEGRCILLKPSDGKHVAPYGPSPVVTWQWLNQHARTVAKRKVIDLGALAWKTLSAQMPEDARSARPEPVTFLEPHLRMLARTSPRPVVEPDIDLLLHGCDRAPGAVSLVWRREAVFEQNDPVGAGEILALLPPTALEACEVPLWEVRAWLAGQATPSDSGDIEGAVMPRLPSSATSGTEYVLRWDGIEDGATLVSAAQLRPGDSVVLAAARGGYDRFGWNPSARTPVEDIAEAAYVQRTGRTIQRIDDPEAVVSGGRVRRWSGGVVVEFTPSDQTRATLRDIEVALEPHRRRVSDRARHDAQALGLDAEAISLAGWHHDDGKAERGWQLCVNGGRLDRLAQPPLAKGRYVVSVLSRLPPRWRHEASSLARLPADAPTLVRWLVATHHGFARPFWPCRAHGVGLADLMDQLHAEYGYWGLARYEAVLRCADRAVSRAEEQGDV